MHTLENVGARFRELRKLAGKTQVQVASAIGMRQEALSRFESGAGMDFSLAKLLRLLQVLDLELDVRPVVRRPTLEDLLAEHRSGASAGPDAR